jgi:hypothetical protein
VLLKSFRARQYFELIDYFKQAALHYGLTKKEGLKLAFLYGKADGVVMPESWEDYESAGNMWLRRLRKSHKSLVLRKPEAASLTQASSFNLENMKAFSENLNKLL